LHAKLDVMTDQIPGIKTYSLAEVVEMVLPPDTKNGVRWLASRLTASAEYRVGRTWRMTRGDVDDLIQHHRNRPETRADVSPCPNDRLTISTWQVVERACPAQFQLVIR
jgi:hypothetical protein